MKHYDVIIIGAGPGGIFAAYELVKNNAQARIACFEKGAELANRRCPIDGKKIKSCIHCPVCSIMSGFGGAGAFSDGKYNITNEFGGNLYEYIGRDEATELMKYVDEINMSHGGEGTRLYSTADTAIKKKCFEHDLKLLGAQVRHLGTDKIGFQVRPSADARRAADREGVEINTYSIIYDAIDDVKQTMQGMLDKVKKEIISGEIEVKQVFKISKVGTVAGGLVTDGKVHNKDKARVIRDGIVIHTAPIDALKRYKDDAKEVATGLECGISLVNFNDIQVGDIIETFTEIEVEQKL